MNYLLKTTKWKLDFPKCIVPWKPRMAKIKIKHDDLTMYLEGKATKPLPF